MIVYSNYFLGSDLAFLLAFTVCFSLMRTSRREQSTVPVASLYELHVLWHYSLPPSCAVPRCSMPWLVQLLKATALLVTPHKGHPKHRGRSRAEHTAWQAFRDACLQSPFGLEGVQLRVVDPLPETGLSSNRTEGSIRKRQLCIMGARMRRQDISVSSSEKEEHGDGTAVTQCPAPCQGQ